MSWPLDLIFFYHGLNLVTSHAFFLTFSQYRPGKFFLLDSPFRVCSFGHESSQPCRDLPRWQTAFGPYVRTDEVRIDTANLGRPN